MDTRAFTTVIVDGERAVGTKLDPTIAAIVLEDGQKYIGETEILGIHHVCSYQPYLDDTGTPVGILFSGIPTDEVDPELLSILILSVIIGVVLLVVSLVISYVYINNKVAKRLTLVVDSANTIAAGDFTARIELEKGNDEISLLVNSFSRMQDNLTSVNRDMQHILGSMADGDWSGNLQTPQAYIGDWRHLRDSIESMSSAVNYTLNQVISSMAQFSTGAQEVAHGAQNLAMSSTKQVESTNKLSDTLTDISDKIGENSNNAQKANEIASDAGNVTKITLKDMNEMLTAMKDIEETSGSIKKIVSVIDDIAFQTNILALNAAVEAARAGSAGKGFAVVADEVRVLAQKSSDAAQDITALIQRTTDTVSNGVTIADKTNVSFKELAEKVGQIVGIIESISSSSTKQLEGIELASSEIADILHAVQMNSATSEESAAASEELSSQSDILNSALNKFKLLK